MAKIQSNGLWVLGITLYLIWCAITGNLDQFVVVVSMIGFTWVIIGNVFEAANRQVKKILPQQRDKPLDVQEKVPVKVQNTAVTAGAIETPAIPVSTDKKWFANLVKNAVHILIIGETNSGKSTAAKAILKARATNGEQIIILDPHARPSTWNGLDAIGRGRDYTAIEQMISILHKEMDRRYKEYSQDDNYNPVRLNIFVDEVPSIATYCDSWQSFFTVLSCEARKVNMSLICLSQSRLVDMLGIKGRSDVRENFTELLLGEKAIRALPETAKQSRPAVVDNGKVQAVDTSMLPGLGSGEINAVVLWIPSEDLTRQKPAEGPYRALEDVTLTSPLTEQEMIQLNDWEDQDMSRRGMARQLYKMRGGKSIDTYRGDGPLFQLIKACLDNDP